MFTIVEGNPLPQPYAALELDASEIELVTDAIEAVLAARPKISARLAKPGTKVIVTKVDPSDKNFVSGGGEFALKLGEVMTVPELIKFLKVPGSKLNASLPRFYFRSNLPFEHSGYTVRTLEHFLRDLKGPAGKDFQPIAEAHAALAAERNEVPFE